MPKKTTSSRTGILQTLDTKTRVMGLISLILEAVLLASLPLLREEDRLLALIVCAVVLVVIIVGMFLIEMREVSAKQQENSILTKPTQNADAEPEIPKELQGNIFEFDKESWNASGDDSALYKTASSMKFAGRYTEAIDFYRRTLNINPNHWNAKYNIASCYLYLHDYEKSEKEFLALIEELKNLNWEKDKRIQRLIRGAYMQLNSVCDSQNKYKNGEAYVLQSLEVVPDDALAYANLAISSKKSEKHEEARNWYQVLMEHPDRLSVLVQMSDSDKAELDQLLTTTTGD